MKMTDDEIEVKVAVGIGGDAGVVLEVIKTNDVFNRDLADFRNSIDELFDEGTELPKREGVYLFKGKSTNIIADVIRHVGEFARLDCEGPNVSLEPEDRITTSLDTIIAFSQSEPGTLNTKIGAEAIITRALAMFTGAVVTETLSKPENANLSAWWTSNDCSINSLIELLCNAIEAQDIEQILTISALISALQRTNERIACED